MRIDVTAVKNFQALHVSQRLFFMLCAVAGDDGAFKIKTSNVAERIGTSERTVRTYLKNYTDCNVIKFKYSGSGRINPDFYYTGELSRFSETRKEYSDFKSDF